MGRRPEVANLALAVGGCVAVVEPLVVDDPKRAEAVACCEALDGRFRVRSEVRVDIDQQCRAVARFEDGLEPAEDRPFVAFDVDLHEREARQVGRGNDVAQPHDLNRGGDGRASFACRVLGTARPRYLGDLEEVWTSHRVRWLPRRASLRPPPRRPRAPAP